MFKDECELIEEIGNEEKVPIWRKTTLSIREAAQYSNIGINRIERLLKDPKCDFVLFVGSRKLVKRKAFEEFLAKTLEI